MNDEYQVHLNIDRLRLSPSDTNTVFIEIETKYDEILRDSTTGHQTLTGRSVRVSPSIRISFNLHSSNPQPIQSLLSTQLVNYPNWLCNQLASEISTEATNLGFGYNGFNLTMTVTVTYQTLVFPGSSSSNHEGSLRTKMLRMVLLGLMKEKEFKSLKMETESCSICLENFSGPNSKPTRMTCSHVFHAPCLVEWLYRKNSCPLCRTELYDR